MVREAGAGWGRDSTTEPISPILRTTYSKYITPYISNDSFPNFLLGRHSANEA